MPEVEELIGPTPPVPILLVDDEVYDEGGEAEEAKRVDGGGVGHEDVWCGPGGCRGEGWV